jgi:hypothetical protein
MELEFEAELYPWDAKPSVVFATLPSDEADAIDDATSVRGGFGSVKVRVQIGATKWSTSLFPSKELETYVLPIKQSVRKAEKLEIGDSVSIRIEPVNVV